MQAPKEKSKGALMPWEVWAIDTDRNCHCHCESFATRALAQECVERLSGDCRVICPVVVHINIPPMEY